LKEKSVFLNLRIFLFLTKLLKKLSPKQILIPFGKINSEIKFESISSKIELGFCNLKKICE
jgi:hypothetical protein